MWTSLQCVDEFIKNFLLIKWLFFSSAGWRCQENGPGIEIWSTRRWLRRRYICGKTCKFTSIFSVWMDLLVNTWILWWICYKRIQSFRVHCYLLVKFIPTSNKLLPIVIKEYKALGSILYPGLHYIYRCFIGNWRINKLLLPPSSFLAPRVL